MIRQPTFTYGKYEALTHCIDDPEMAQAYFEACVTDTVRSGFDHETAERIEHENIINYAKRFDSFSQGRINALFSRITKNTKQA
jgi:hypothetical protein